VDSNGLVLPDNVRQRLGHLDNARGASGEDEAEAREKEDGERLSDESLIHKETRYVKDSIENLRISQHSCPFFRKGNALTKQCSSGTKDQTPRIVNPLKN
jgi:hypothetical protein